MRGENLLSRLAAWSTFVVFPSGVIAYCLTMPRVKPPKKENVPSSSSSKSVKGNADQSKANRERLVHRLAVDGHAAWMVISRLLV
ncbi:hypothetical protein MUK42_29878 [Musa troglodytarum]|uniref:Uncharacterized protein n=1 Tax=Musa troglodytarum TaxID=320322 RepID=A0A9E7FNC4_9LILI|nr:hypothetical protein MUK42_29878 [Musa troglodytarum]